MDQTDDLRKKYRAEERRLTDMINEWLYKRGYNNHYGGWTEDALAVLKDTDEKIGARYQKMLTAKRAYYQDQGDPVPKEKPLPPMEPLLLSTPLVDWLMDETLVERAWQARETEEEVGKSVLEQVKQLGYDLWAYIKLSEDEKKAHPKLLEIEKPLIEARDLLFKAENAALNSRRPVPVMPGMTPETDRLEWLTQGKRAARPRLDQLRYLYYNYCDQRYHLELQAATWLIERRIGDYEQRIQDALTILLNTDERTKGQYQDTLEAKEAYYRYRGLEPQEEPPLPPMDPLLMVRLGIDHWRDRKLEQAVLQANKKYTIRLRHCCLVLDASEETAWSVPQRKAKQSNRSET